MLTISACRKFFSNPKPAEIAIINTPHGDIKIRFFEDIAPKHVESFKKLTNKGFYDNTTFHRVIPGFMIQGGDPNSKDQSKRRLHGTGGPGYTVPAEFSDRNHIRGIVSAARGPNPDSAGSQFFIVVADAPHLDGQYSAFGEVIEGMEVADQIAAEQRDSADNPIKPMTMTVKIKSLEEEKVKSPKE